MTFFYYLQIQHSLTVYPLVPDNYPVGFFIRPEDYSIYPVSTLIVDN